MRFYLGTHEVSWLGRTAVPLFISHRRLTKRKSFPKALGRWSLDSGGFTELKMFGKWETSPEQYIDAVGKYASEVGNLDWAAPQDWMCEPWVLSGGTHGGQSFEGTGLSVREHQERTVANFLELRALAPELPFIPVLQGFTTPEYVDCVDLYASAGVDLRTLPVVGLGSVCRRQASDEIDELVSELSARGILLHGFGVKKTGLYKYGPKLISADSMAWSYRARMTEPIPGHTHIRCNNCLEFALRWRDETLARLPARGILRTVADWRYSVTSAPSGGFDVREPEPQPRPVRFVGAQRSPRLLPRRDVPHARVVRHGDGVSEGATPPDEGSWCEPVGSC